VPDGPYSLASDALIEPVTPITPDSIVIAPIYSSATLSQQRRQLQRRLVIQELLETEQMYVNDLKMLVENCFDRINAVSWLPLDKKCLLIRNATELFKFQEEFLSHMERVIPASLDDVQDLDLPIGSIFIDMEEKFEVCFHCSFLPGPTSFINSTIINSTIINSTIINSTIINSTMINENAHFIIRFIRITAHSMMELSKSCLSWKRNQKWSISCKISKERLRRGWMFEIFLSSLSNGSANTPCS
jgi:hypothetical protein